MLALLGRSHLILPTEAGTIMTLTLQIRKGRFGEKSLCWVAQLVWDETGVSPSMAGLQEVSSMTSTSETVSSNRLWPVSRGYSQAGRLGRHTKVTQYQGRYRAEGRAKPLR